MGSLLLFLNIIYISITSARERWARGKVVGLEVSEKLERKRETTENVQA